MSHHLDSKTVLMNQFSQKINLKQRMEETIVWTRTIRAKTRSKSRTFWELWREILKLLCLETLDTVLSSHLQMPSSDGIHVLTAYPS